MSLAAVAVRNQRKKQKLAVMLPTAQLPGGPALLVLELGKMQPKVRKSSAGSQVSSNSSSANTEEVKKSYCKIKLTFLYHETSVIVWIL